MEEDQGNAGGRRPVGLARGTVAGGHSGGCGHTERADDVGVAGHGTDNAMHQLLEHPKQDRAISAREAASLQTFPKDFEFMGSLTSQARQIGNAVPILLAESVGRHLLAHLNRAVDTAMRQQPAAA